MADPLIITLEYHDVVADGDVHASGFDYPGAELYKLDATDFEAHLDAVQAKASTVGIPVGVRVETALASASPSVLLTFDDGGVSALDIADRLERRGWRGHFLMTTDHVGAPGFVDAAQLRDLHARGHSIGSHSCSHPPRLSALSRARIGDEWGRSCEVLADILGVPTTVASVPGGFLSRTVAEEAARVGIRALFTSEPTMRGHDIDGCRLLGRFTLRRSHAPSVAASLVSVRSKARLRQRATWTALRLVKRISGPLYMPLRAVILRKG